MDAIKLARGLGWFSIGLGLGELFAGRRLARLLGLEEHVRLLRLFGLREIATGAGILASGGTSAWLWARVAGDALDVLLLRSALAGWNPQRGKAKLALGNVLAISALDVACARQLPV